jgi:hypothetical protein
MSAVDRILRILLQTTADPRGIDDVKRRLQDLKGAAAETGETASNAGSLIGVGFGGAAVAALSLAYSKTVELTEQELRLATEIKGTTDKLSNQELEWFALADAAKTFTDAARLGVAAISQVAQLTEKAIEAQRTAQAGPGLLESTLEFLANIGNPGQKVRPWTDALNEQAKAYKAIADNARVAAVGAEHFAELQATEFQALKNLPVDESIAKIRQSIVDLSQKRAGLNPLASTDEFAQYERLNASIAHRTDLLGEMLKKQQQQREALKATGDQTRLNQAAGDEELTIQEKVTQAYDKKFNELKKLGIGEKQAAAAAHDFAESLRQSLEVRAGTSADTSDQERLTALLRQQATILQNIRQQQELIRGNPLLGADDKDAAMLSLYLREMTTLQGQITALKSEAKNSALDPAQLEQVNQKLQQTVFEAQLLGLKVVGLQHPFTTELMNWANSFGTASQQAAHALTGTLGTAINGISGAITGLIFHTGNWRQAVAQTAESIVQNLIQVGIQMLVTKALGTAVRASTVAESAVAGPSIAAAYAPAAAASSVASYGSSAIVGEAAALAAIAAIVGALVLHEGGAVRSRKLRRFHSGGLQPDEVPIIAQEGEFMIQRSVAQQPGMIDFLAALNAGMMFHGGGFIPGGRYHRGGGGPSSHITGGQNFFGTGRFAIFNPNDPRYAPDLPPDQTEPDAFDNPLAGRFFTGFGTSPSFGISIFGPTQIPTFWVNYPGVGNVPMAVPVGGWQPDPTQPWSGARTQYLPKTKHFGGSIGRLHLGGQSRVSRECTAADR